MKLNTKLIFSYFVLGAIPTLVITFLMYGKIYDIIKVDTTNSEYALCEQTSSTLEATLTQITNLSNTILDSDYLQNILSANNVLFTEETSFEQQTISFLNFIEGSIDGTVITDIKIFANIPDAEQFHKKYDSKLSVFQPLENARGTYWHGIFSSTYSSSLFCPSFYLSPDELKDNGDLAYIYRISNLASRNNATAYVAVYFSEETVQHILKENSSHIQSVSYVINRRNNVITSTRPENLASYLMDVNDLRKSINSSESYVKAKVLDEIIYSSCHPIDGTDWYLVSVLPYKSLVERSTSIVLKYMLLYLFVVIITLFVALQISHSISTRISSVIRQMSKVRFGKPVKMPRDTQHDEIGDLIDTYNYMAAKIDELLKEQETAAKNLRTSEFDALQAQINPHFLYNTLDMINWLSISGKNQEVSAAIQSLSKFYKLTLSKKDTIGTVAKEIEHVSLYVELQNMRYQNKIHFIVDVPDELLDYEMPKLTFQPIIENSIQHGIFEKENKEGTIVLTAWLAEPDIVFLISDDGVGMTKKQVKEILYGNTTGSKGSNIGVYNTHQRLRLFYGEGYGLSYSSTLGEGTEVSIRIPAQQKTSRNLL